MIKKPTVLILGAGASIPYGYPSGKDLKEIIITFLVSDSTSRFKVLSELGHTRREIINFRDALRYSGKSSVDAFLEYRKEFVEIGKAAMALVLMGYELTDRMFDQGDWYQYLYERLSTSFEEFDRNTVSIVTFNYDRSLEHYLFTALRNSYGKNEEDCARKLRTIAILHVHGQIGYLPWQNEGGRPYEIKPESLSQGIDYTYYENIQEAAAQIRIIHDDINLEEDEQFSRANEILSTAERVYFIGFGYHEKNVERLKIGLCQERRNKLVYLGGTAVGLGEAEILSVQGLFKSQKLNITLHDLNALEFFKQKVNL